MLSRALLRDRPDEVRELLATRGVNPEMFNTWVKLDRERRDILVEVEELKRRRNEASKEIGSLKSQGGDATSQIEVVGQLKGQIAGMEERVNEVTADLAAVELGLPNLPDDSVPRGDDESANRVERVVGEATKFDFEPKAHWDLGPELGILDFERGAKITGARFTAYFGAGARLERALINFFLDLHTGEHGYTEVLPPFIVSADSLVGSGQLPKFEEDLFKLVDHEYYLAPTAEVPLTNLHRNETIEEAALPLRYVAFTPCFRAEAGSHGRDVRGLIRQHQFNKVELFQFTLPDKSYEALEQLTGQAEKVLQLLELPYHGRCPCRPVTWALPPPRPTISRSGCLGKRPTVRSPRARTARPFRPGAPTSVTNRRRVARHAISIPSTARDWPSGARWSPCWRTTSRQTAR